MQYTLARTHTSTHTCTYTNIRTSCLVFNHPHSEGWSLLGQIYSISFCFRPPSIVFQTTFQPIFPCCQSIAFLVSLSSRSRCSAIHDLFLQTISFFRHGRVWYSSIYIAPLNTRGPTEALVVRLAPRKETSFKK